MAAKGVMDSAAAFTDFLMNPGVELNIPDLSGMNGLPEFPARPDLSKLNSDGYKSIAQNINQTVNNVLSSSRAGTAYAQSVMDGLQNGSVDPEIAKKNISTISNNLQTHIDNLSYVIDVMARLEQGAQTEFGQNFFKTRKEHLTDIKNGQQDLNNRFKRLNDLISTGQEVKQDVRDGINQKLNETNALIDRAEKDYNETFVADYKRQLAR